jgi:L-amino acid N-acyltransferase YncA
MIIREFQENDQSAVEEIAALYWTDPEFLKELSGELRSYLNRSSSKDSGFFVAEENDGILGFVGFRKLPNYLRFYAQTSNPIEFYVIAVKNKGKGVGEKLKLKLIEEVEKLGFSEILLYSPGSHDESWNFHDKFGFERVGEITPPEDDAGYLWRKILN